MPVSRRRRVRLLVLVALLAVPSVASAQTPLLEDGGFAQWTTVAGIAGHQVTGGVEAAAGQPPPSYRLEHEHVAGGTFAASVVSRSTYQGGLIGLGGFALADRLELRVDACVGVLEGQAGEFPVELAVQPVLLQGEVVFRPQQVASRTDTATCATGSPVLAPLSLSVPLGSFRGPGDQQLDLSVGAPRVRLSLTVQTTWFLLGTVLARLDNLSLRRIPAGGPPVTLELSDLGQGWANELGETIDYRLTVDNGGPPLGDLLVEVRLPTNTCFSPDGSTAGWQCGPDLSRACSVDGEGLCTYRIGALARGESAEIDLAVTLQAGVPAEWEFLAEARLLAQGGGELASADEVTPPVALVGPGCLCLFLTDLCAE